MQQRYFKGRKSKKVISLNRKLFPEIRLKISRRRRSASWTGRKSSLLFSPSYFTVSQVSSQFGSSSSSMVASFQVKSLKVEFSRRSIRSFSAFSQYGDIFLSSSIEDFLFFSRVSSVSEGQRVLLLPEFKIMGRILAAAAAYLHMQTDVVSKSERTLVVVMTSSTIIFPELEN